jgi:glucarate dehydratase
MLHLAASTPNFPLANDCTYYGLVDDVITRPFQIRHGRLPVPEAPGLGIEVDLAKVRRFQAAASC